MLEREISLTDWGWFHFLDCLVEKEKKNRKKKLKKKKRTFASNAVSLIFQS